LPARFPILQCLQGSFSVQFRSVHTIRIACLSRRSLASEGADGRKLANPRVDMRMVGQTSARFVLARSSSSLALTPLAHLFHRLPADQQVAWKVGLVSWRGHLLHGSKSRSLHKAGHSKLSPDRARLRTLELTHHHSQESSFPLVKARRRHTRTDHLADLSSLSLSLGAGNYCGRAKSELGC